MSYEPYEILLLHQISSQIGDAVNKVISEILNPTKTPLAKLIEASEDPMASACIQLKSARAMQIMSVDYKHKNPQIQKWGRNTVENMEGTISEFVGRMSSALPFGFSASEIIVKKTARQYKLKRFHYLNPEHTTFAAKKGNLEKAYYKEGAVKKTIPIWKVIHITNGLVSNFGAKFVYGSSEMKRAYPFVRLKQLLFGEIGVTAKRLATGLLIAKTDSNQRVQLLDRFGNPIKDERTGQTKTISSTENLSKQLKGLENNSFIVTDKNNDFYPISIPAGEQFWNLAKIMIDEQIMRSFLIPDTIWQQGVASFGVGALSVTQLNVLDSSIQALVQQIKDQLIDKVFRLLVKLNFGIQEDYGDFPINELKEDPQKDATLVGNLVTVLSTGLIPNNDINAINLLREKLTLPPVSPEEQSFIQQLQAQLARLNASSPELPSSEQMQQMSTEKEV